MNKISEAILFVTTAFDGQRRKCENTPAVFHSLEAGYIAQTITDDEDIVTATLLHDTVEDAGITLEEIEERFGGCVAHLVSSETEDKRLNQNPADSWYERKEEAINILKKSNDLGVKILFLSDKLSNMRSLYRSKQKFGDELWQMFHQTDPQAHYWYYDSIAKSLEELTDTLAYKEYVELIHRTFLEE